MSEPTATREMTREELIEENNKLRADKGKLMLENDKLRVESEELRARLDKKCLEHELRYRDGVIHGLKYAARCNGMSGGDIEG